MLGLMLTLFACSFGSGEPNKNQQTKPKTKGIVENTHTKPKAKGIAENTTSQRAVVGDFKVKVPEGSHTVVSADMGSDYNVYPAEN